MLRSAESYRGSQDLFLSNDIKCIELHSARIAVATVVCIDTSTGVTTLRAVCPQLQRLPRYFSHSAQGSEAFEAEASPFRGGQSLGTLAKLLVRRLDPRSNVTFSGDVNAVKWINP